MAERLSPNETKKVDVPVKDSKHDVAVKVAENMAEEHRGKTVVSNTVKPKKPTFGDKLKGCFFEGEVESVSDYIVFDVVVPAIKSTIVNVVCGGIESLVMVSQAQIAQALDQITHSTQDHRHDQTIMQPQFVRIHLELLSTSMRQKKTLMQFSSR